MIAGSVFGQDQGRIAEKKKILKTAKGLNRAKVLNQIAFEFRNSIPDSTIYFCQQSISIAESIKDRGVIAESYNFIGLAYAYKAMPKEAMRHYDQALEIASGVSDSIQIAFSFNNRGRLLFELADLKGAYENFTKSQIIFESLNNKEGYRISTEAYRIFIVRSTTMIMPLQWHSKRVTFEKNLANQGVSFLH